MIPADEHASRENYSLFVAQAPCSAYPTTGTCRFRNSSGATAIAAMNSRAAGSPVTGRLNGRGEPTTPPRNSFNQPRNSCSIRRRRQIVTRYDIVFSQMQDPSCHLLYGFCICIQSLIILLSRARRQNLHRDSMHFEY